MSTAHIAAADHALGLEFWGLSVRLALPTVHDVRHFTFQFRNYLSGPGRPGLLLRFTNSGTQPWCQALLDPGARKTIEYHAAGREPAIYETWRTLSSKPSPLPPLQFLPSMRPLAVHAACAAPPRDSDGAVVITGASGSGKSSLLLYLLDEGWSYVADDLVPYLNGRVWTYLRTMNIRGHTLATLPSRKQEAPRLPHERQGKPARTAGRGLRETLRAHPRGT